MKKDLPKNTDVVVIGAGIMGCCVAYYLVKLGCKNVVMIEKGYSMASGASTYAAGLLTKFTPSLTSMLLRKESVRLYKELVEYKQVGSMRIAVSDKQLEFLQYDVSRVNGFCLKSGLYKVITAEEIKNILPWTKNKDVIDLDQICGAIWLPEDGVFNAYDVTNAVGNAAKGLGVKIYLNTRVTGIELLNNEVKKVKTEHGDIETKIVVNAAGMWGKRIANMVGIDVPVIPVDHQHQVLQFKPGVVLGEKAGKQRLVKLPSFRNFNHVTYWRFCSEGSILGAWERNPRTPWKDREYSPPWSHSSKETANDQEHFLEHVVNTTELYPFINTDKVGLGRLISHPDGFTPDSNPLMGHWPDIKGFYFACAMSMHGFGAAGGLGKSLAELILKGASTIDISDYIPHRFGDTFSNIEDAVKRSREVYSDYYDRKYPGDAYKSSRNLLLSPLYHEVKELGAVFSVKDGWERPSHFTEEGKSRQIKWDQRKWGGLSVKPLHFNLIADEHKAVREQVGMFDLSSFGKIEVKGPEALKLLQYLSVSDVDWSIGSVIYTQFCDQSGGIVSDITITRLAENTFRIISGTSQLQQDLGWIKLNASNYKLVEIKDVTKNYACIGLWGPRARRVFENVFRQHMASGYISIDGETVLAKRVSYVGEFGWEIYVPVFEDRPQKVWRKLMKDGEKFGIKLAGYESINSLRMEKGMLAYGIDLTRRQNPFEAGLGWCVDFEKDEDFIGRKALLKVRNNGVKQKMCTLVIGGEDWLPIYGGEAVITRHGEVVSRLCSTGYGHTVKRNIAFAYLPLDLIQKNLWFDVMVLDKIVSAYITDRVLVK
ncbi:FAD-dependent oxidoreductase [Patescibacteria group bacterium]